MQTSPGSRLAEALRANDRIEPLGQEVLASLDEAYATQAAFLAALDEPVAGWKIGATNAKSQGLMGLDAPFYGPMPERFCHESPAEVKAAPGLIGAEIEIAFRLKADLPKRAETYTRDEIIQAIEGAYPAIEVIGLRQVWDGVPEGRHAIADLGANCIFAHSHSPAPGLLDALIEDPTSVQARCLVDGQETGKGDASLVLENPITALGWLADHGPGLKAGSWISTGTMTGLATFQGSVSLEGDFGAFGQVRLAVKA